MKLVLVDLYQSIPQGEDDMAARWTNMFANSHEMQLVTETSLGGEVLYELLFDTMEWQSFVWFALTKAESTYSWIVEIRCTRIGNDRKTDLKKEENNGPSIP